MRVACHGLAIGVRCVELEAVPRGDAEIKQRAAA
jgi:hypothetical protein